jgi:hypothetical protein
LKSSLPVSIWPLQSPSSSPKPTFRQI